MLPANVVLFSFLFLPSRAGSCEVDSYWSYRGSGYSLRPKKKKRKKTCFLLDSIICWCWKTYKLDFISNRAICLGFLFHFYEPFSVPSFLGLSPSQLNLGSHSEVHACIKIL
jgi:hypothetical protein